MNISTLFQPVGGRCSLWHTAAPLPRRSSLYGAVRRKEKRPFSMSNSHAAPFRVCVSLLADRRITAAVCKQTLFQGGVVGADMDKGGLSRQTKYRWVFSCLVSPVSHANSFLCPCYAIGAFFGVFSPALDLEKTAFLTIKTARTWNVSSGRLLSQDFRFFRLLTVRRR